MRIHNKLCSPNCTSSVAATEPVTTRMDRFATIIAKRFVTSEAEDDKARKSSEQTAKVFIKGILYVVLAGLVVWTYFMLPKSQKTLEYECAAQLDRYPDDCGWVITPNHWCLRDVGVDNATTIQLPRLKALAQLQGPNVKLEERVAGCPHKITTSRASWVRVISGKYEEERWFAGPLAWCLQHLFDRENRLLKCD